jgi:hypothetical protein
MLASLCENTPTQSRCVVVSSRRVGNMSPGVKHFFLGNV